MSPGGWRLRYEAALAVDIEGILDEDKRSKHNIVIEALRSVISMHLVNEAYDVHLVLPAERQATVCS